MKQLYCSLPILCFSPHLTVELVGASDFCNVIVILMLNLLEQPHEVGSSRKMRRSMSNGNLVMFSEQKGRLLQEPTCKVIK